MASSDIAWREGTDGLDVTSHLAARQRQMPKPVAVPAAKAEACAHTYATVRRLGLADPGRRPTARPKAPPARRVVETSLPPAHRPLFCTHA